MESTWVLAESKIDIKRTWEMRNALRERNFASSIVLVGDLKTKILLDKSHKKTLTVLLNTYDHTSKMNNVLTPNSIMSHCGWYVDKPYKAAHEEKCDRCTEVMQTHKEIRSEAQQRIQHEVNTLNNQNAQAEVNNVTFTKERGEDFVRVQPPKAKNDSKATRGRPRKYSLTEKQNALHLVQQTGSITKTCEITGISRRAISKWKNEYLINKEGISGYRYSLEEKQLAEELLHENLGNVTLTCYMTGIDSNTINRWLLKGHIQPYEGEDAYVKLNRGKEYDSKEKQKAIEMYHEIGSIHEVSKATGIPDPTLHGWIRPEVKYERLSIKELNEKYEYHMNQADLIDRIKTEKEAKYSKSLEKISQLEAFLKTTIDDGMEQLAKLKKEIE